MDSRGSTERPVAVDGDAADRDVRDVLAGLVVGDGAGTDESLRAVARAAGGSDRLVPELLSALGDDATAVRIGAAWTLCALADDQPAAVDYLAKRLATWSERGGGEEPFEVEQVLSYLRGSYPGRVADAVDSAAALGALDADGGRRAAADGTDDRTTHGTPTGSGERAGAGSSGERVETDGGVGGTAVADLGDGRQVVRPSGRRGGVHQRPVEPGAERPVRPDEPDRSAAVPETHPTHPEFDDADAEPTTTEPAAPTESDGAAERTPTIGTHAPETPETFAAIGALSSFDRLSAVAEGCEARFATGYRCRAVEDDEERGVATRLFERPDECDRLDFAADLTKRLSRWRALADGERVVDLFEWGDRPRPWVATQPVDDSLAERDRPPVDEALAQAEQLADAVAHCHRHGTVHAGIDPKSVVFRGDALSGLERPMLDNVGLMHAFREYFQPANYLDPRFAAPEYFDTDFGRVDAATDVYGLGATCYYLFTGRPPYAGSYCEVREGVIDGRPPAPSAVNEAVPEELDSVLGKAMAREKMKRYDAVEGFRNDLEAVGGD
ncbi:serine/threonine protein kinase [Halosimplex carlsbadense 2-9-1]|uniref:Serine/threonine protein kinase n=1 Tax=Halosimplex carlsbadense 2-9-1 TaxID=797114 RepID=M0D3I6_9EURY|nr:serine/threonine protein kinase [Halosimplex carlsbadense]ELZ29413.1 serine/threonine protein kinase [Halosimplex carlsbadense 2-9-1]